MHLADKFYQLAFYYVCPLSGVFSSLTCMINLLPTMELRMP